MHNLLCGNSLEILKTLKEKSIDLIVTSPPYFKLRDYKHLNQYGNEAKSADYIGNLFEVFRECGRVIKDTGAIWINISDTTIKGEMQNIPERINHFMTVPLNYRKRKTIIWHKPSVLPQGN